LPPWGARQFPTQGGAGNPFAGGQATAGQIFSVCAPVTWICIRPVSPNAFFDPWFPSTTFQQIANPDPTEAHYSNSRDDGAQRLVMKMIWGIFPPFPDPMYRFEVVGENPATVAGVGDQNFSTFFIDTNNFRSTIFNPPPPAPPSESELLGFNPSWYPGP